MIRILTVLALSLALAACDDSTYSGSGTTENNGSNNGANNGPANNGPANNGPANNGPANNGPANNGPANNGPANNGPANNGPVGLPEPERHRPEALICDDVRPEWEDPQGGNENDPCFAHADCDEGPNGRCLQGRGGNYCDYDGCFANEECDGACFCGEDSGSNRCIDNGNCASNEECGPGGWCSPSFGGCGSYSGFVAYYCRTAKDECLNDFDCEDPNRFGGYCAFNETAGHWACSWDECDG